MKERKQNRMADIMPVLTLIYTTHPPPALTAPLLYVAALCGPWPLVFVRAIVKAKLAERRRTTNFLPVGHKINSIIL